MAIGLSMIEQLEDLRSLSTGQLKGMLGTPSPHASPVFIAMVLKEREDAEKRHAGREAAAQTAQQAPTVAHRLAGQQQPMPMSRAGAMAAPPQQPPMPQEAQLAMALSGATGRPPPELPTVNMQGGTAGAAMRSLVKAMQREGTRTASQMSKHKGFSYERPDPVYNEGGLGALIAAIVEAQSEKSKAHGGFAIPRDDEFPRGRSGARAAARPVSMANGTQGRTVYAVDGWPSPPPAPTLLPKRSTGGDLSSRLPLATASALGYLERLAAARGGDSATYKKELDAVLDALGSGPNGAKYGEGRQNLFDALGVGTGAVPDAPPLAVPRQQGGEMTDAEGAALAAALGGRLGATERVPVDQAAPLLSPEQKRLWQGGWVANPPIPQEFQGAPGPQVDADVMDFEFGGGESGPAKEAAQEIVAPRTRGVPSAPAEERDDPRDVFGRQVDAFFAGSGSPEETRKRLWDLPMDFLKGIVTEWGPRVATEEDMSRRDDAARVWEERRNVEAAREFSGSEAIPDEVYGAGVGVLSGGRMPQRFRPVPPPAIVDPQMMARSLGQDVPPYAPPVDWGWAPSSRPLPPPSRPVAEVAPPPPLRPEEVILAQPHGDAMQKPAMVPAVDGQAEFARRWDTIPEKVAPVDDQSEFARWWDRTQKEGAAADSRDNRSAAQVWWDDRQARSRVKAKEVRDLRGRRDFLDGFRSDIGRPGSVLGWFTRTPQERQQGLLVQQEFESVRPLLESDPVLFGRFGEDPQAFIEDRLEQKAAARTMLGEGAADIEAVVAEKSAVTAVKAQAAEVRAAEAPPPIPRLVVNDPKKLKMAAAPRVIVGKAGEQVTSSPVDGKIVDVRDIYQSSLDQLSAGTRKAYEDMDAKLKQVSELNKADFEKLGESFKALDDFYKTGKLPERMRESRITNLLLELAKGFLGKQTMPEALEAGIAGFQAVDAKDRKQYAEGLSAMLTANQALLSAKMTMRNGELKERQALIRGRRQESLGNVQLATEQMKVASQENERVRTAAYRIEMAGIARINANANLLNAQTTTLQKNIRGLADADLTRLRAALERGKNDPAYRATPQYRAATEELGRKFIVGEDGTAHPDFLVYGKMVQDVTKTPSTYRAEMTQGRFDSQKVAFNTRINRALAPLLEGRASTDKELWKAIAASAKIPLPKDGRIGSQWFTDNNAALRKAARLYIGRRMAAEDDPTLPRMRQWLEDRGFLGQQGGAAQGEKRDPADVRSGITGATN